MVDFAELDLTQLEHPICKRFNEAYYNCLGPQSLAEQVYFTHNQLPTRWRSHQQSFFTIGETRFGTGLNFLFAWEALRQQHCSLRLHFVSFEQYPIQSHQLALILHPWRHLLSGAEALIEAYCHLVPGWNRLSFKDAELTLWIGDITTGLSDLNAQVDAWFLEGFSPERNPQFWQPKLFKALALCSHKSTTLATLTVAQQVLDGLTAAGFKCQIQPGQSHPYQSLSGQFVGAMGPKRTVPGWPRPQPIAHPKIGIIGAGLAAAELASSAQRRGLSVSVFAPNANTLGNIQGAVYARPGLEADPNTQWYASALSYRLRRWQQVGSNWPGARSGLLQLLDPSRWQKMQQNFTQHPFAQLCTMVDAKAASLLAGTEINQPALWFAEGGWLSLQSYIEQQLAAIHRFNTLIVDLTPSPTGWLLKDAQSQCHWFDHVIIASGPSAAHWPFSQHLPIQPVRGQITAIQGGTGPNCVICGQRYVTPSRCDGKWHVGATFQPNQTQLETQATDRLANQQALADLAPGLIPADWENQASDAVGIRAASPDRLPMAGPLVKKSDSSAQAWLWHTLSYQPGLWVMTGLGSKGLSSAPLLAEYVISQITGEPLPFGHYLEHRIHAERFWRKAQAKP